MCFSASQLLIHDEIDVLSIHADAFVKPILLSSVTEIFDSQNNSPDESCEKLCEICETKL